MTNESNPRNVTEPDMNRARETANLAHDVVIKLKEMGLPEDQDDALSSLSTDLGDLWSAQIGLTNRLELFLKSKTDWGTVGDDLVDIRSEIDHLAWHLNSIRRPLTRVTQFAYRQAQNGDGSGDIG